MTRFGLLLRNLRYFRAANIAVAAGMAVATAVLTGALLVGDSVRGSLHELALQRLGPVDYALAAPRFFDQSLTNALATGGAHTYEVTVPIEARSHPLRISLVWSDPPGNPIAGVKLVNDLNLSVTGDATNAVAQGTNSAVTNTSKLLWLGNNFPAGSDFTASIALSSSDTNVITTTNVQETINLINLTGRFP